MRLFRPRLLLVLLASAVLHAPLLGAVDVLQMNLQDMTQRADKIFRGTVLDFTTGTVTAGGGEIPTVTYRLRVDESFKGSYITREDVQIAEIKMIGTLKKAPAPTGGIQRLPFLPEVPRLKIGKDYLLFTTAPSTVGLSTTVGLGQGCFSFVFMNKEEMAVNGFGNAGIFKDMPEAGPSSPGAVPYSELADQIRALLAE